MAFLPNPRMTFALVALAAGSALPVGAQGLPRDPGQQIFEAACASCHYRGAGKAAFGTRSPLADGNPDGLAQYILFGKATEGDEGGMPAFGPVLTDADIVRLANWLRSTARPDAPWSEVESRVAKMRATGTRED